MDVFLGILTTLLASYMVVSVVFSVKRWGLRSILLIPITLLTVSLLFIPKVKEFQVDKSLINASISPTWPWKAFNSTSYNWIYRKIDTYCKNNSYITIGYLTVYSNQSVYFQSAIDNEIVSYFKELNADEALAKRGQTIVHYHNFNNFAPDTYITKIISVRNGTTFFAQEKALSLKGDTITKISCFLFPLLLAWILYQAHCRLSEAPFYKGQSINDFGMRKIFAWPWAKQEAKYFIRYFTPAPYRKNPKLNPNSQQDAYKLRVEALCLSSCQIEANLQQVFVYDCLQEYLDNLLTKKNVPDIPRTGSVVDLNNQLKDYGVLAIRIISQTTNDEDESPKKSKYRPTREYGTPSDVEASLSGHIFD